MSRIRTKIRFRLSLRTILAFFVVLAMALAWVSYEFRRAQRQEELVARIRKIGGSVTYSWETVTRNRSNDGKAWSRGMVAKLFGRDFLSTVDGIDLSGTEIADADLAGLVGFPDLEHLRLANTHVSDVGVDLLTRLSTVKCLDLSQTSVTDASLARLGRMRGLRLLYVYKTRMSPDGVANLRISLPECDVVY